MMATPMIGYTVFMLHMLLDALMEIRRAFGTAFLLRFLEALDKPWTVKR